MQAEGWYRDPYLRHDARWYSAGTPTSLVRDDGVVSDDPVPAGADDRQAPAPLELGGADAYRPEPAPEPLVRPGVDDPIGLAPAASMVRFGTSSWRFPLLGLAGAVVLAVLGAPLFALLLVLVALVPVLWLPGTVRNLAITRSMRRRSARGDALHLETEHSPLIRTRDVVAAIVVAAEAVVLVLILVHEF